MLGRNQVPYPFSAISQLFARCLISTFQWKLWWSQLQNLVKFSSSLSTDRENNRENFKFYHLSINLIGSFDVTKRTVFLYWAKTIVTVRSHFTTAMCVFFCQRVQTVTMVTMKHISDNTKIMKTTSKICLVVAKCEWTLTLDENWIVFEIGLGIDVFNSSIGDPL